MAGEGNVDDNGENDFISHAFAKLTNVIDRNIRELKFVAYGVAVAGGVLVLRSTFAMRKFRQVSDIPQVYIETHAKLQGIVKAVSPPGVLHVDHIPVISLQWLHKHGDGNLLVQLAGVKVFPAGETWLRQTLSGKQVWFKLLSKKDGRQLDCEVTAKKNWFRSVNVNRKIVSLGLAHVLPAEETLHSPVYKNLSQTLLKAELYADKKGLGVWTRPSRLERIQAMPASILRRMFSIIWNFPSSVIRRGQKKTLISEKKGDQTSRNDDNKELNSSQSKEYQPQQSEPGTKTTER